MRCGNGEFAEAQRLRLGAGGVTGLSGVRDVTFLGDSVWAAGYDSRELLRIDESMAIVERVSLDGAPTALGTLDETVYYALGALGRVAEIGGDTLVDDERLVDTREMVSAEGTLVVASGSGLYRVAAAGGVSEVASLSGAGSVAVSGNSVYGATRDADRVVRIIDGAVEDIELPESFAPEAVAADSSLVVIGGRGLYVGTATEKPVSVALPTPFGIEHGYDDEVPATVHAVALTDTHVYATTFYGGYVAQYDRDGIASATPQLLTLQPPVSDDDWDEDSYGDVVGWDPTKDTGLTRLRVHDERLFVSSAVWGYVGQTNMQTGMDVTTFEGEGGVSQLGGAYSLALSADKRHLYVGAWNNPEPSAWSVNPATSKLTPVLPAGAPRRPVNYGTPDVAIAGDGGQVFAIDDQFNRLHVYDRDRDSGRFTWRDALADEVPLELLVALAAAPDGRAIWASDFEADTLLSFSRSPDTGEVVLANVFVEGQDGVAGLAGSEDVVPSMDNRHVYVVAFESQGVSIWQRGEAGLSYAGLHQAPDTGPDDDGMYGVEAAALTDDGRRMVVISPVRDRLFVLDRDPESGALSQRQRYAFDELYSGPPLSNRQADPGRVALSPDGKQVYLSLRRWNAVGGLSMDPDNGALRWEHTWTAQDDSGVLTWPNGVQVSPAGDLWVASLLGDSLMTLTVQGAGPGQPDGCGGSCP